MPRNYGPLGGLDCVYWGDQLGFWAFTFVLVLLLPLKLACSYWPFITFVLVILLVSAVNYRARGSAFEWLHIAFAYTIHRTEQLSLYIIIIFENLGGILSWSEYCTVSTFIHISLIVTKWLPHIRRLETGHRVEPHINTVSFKKFDSQIREPIPCKNTNQSFAFGLEIRCFRFFLGFLAPVTS